jgi:hypothetical protein
VWHGFEMLQNLHNSFDNIRAKLAAYFYIVKGVKWNVFNRLGCKDENFKNKRLNP